MTWIPPADVELALELALAANAVALRVSAAVAGLLLLFLPNLDAVVNKGQFSLCWAGCSCIVCQTVRESEARSGSGSR